jgi:DUF917 family protein
MRRELNAEDAVDAIWGGSVLACGGGGWVEHGELMGGVATSVGRPVLASVDEVDDDAIVATVTAIGAPAAEGWEIRPLDYVRALQILQEQVGKPIAGVMTAQNGSSTTLNGWIQSAILGVPVLDATGDVRAHPTGKQGGLGLTTRPGYETIQVVAGGSRAKQGGALEVIARGPVVVTDDVLRDVSVRAGGFIASARNPVEAAWVKRHAAVGGVSYALALGKAMRKAAGTGRKAKGSAVIDAVVETTGGTILGSGAARIVEPVRTEGGFDHGVFEVGGVRLAFLNEYMAADTRDGQRLGTYPDVLTTLSLETGRPVSIAHLREGDEVAAVHVDRSKLTVSSSASDPVALAEVEQIMGIDLVKYL